MSTTLSFVSGHGLATVASDGSVLDTWFPHPQPNPLAENHDDQLLASLERQTGVDAERGVELVVVSVESDLAAPAQDTHDVWLRLHALSTRLATPNSINLEGIFGFLTNVVWTNFGPCAVADFEETRLKLRRRGKVTVLGLDKFPPMLDYVVPSGVRIADASRVRLGAHLAEGTTVMHEGFINFNAGTLGTSMVEGRISAGVVVGNGTDIGGGASIMGTLSGGGKEKITLGENVLLGANAGVGISLGDGSVVEAGLYVTAATKVAVLDSSGQHQDTVKGSELSGVADTLFIRNSESGRVEARPRSGSSIALNSVLHAN